MSLTVFYIMYSIVAMLFVISLLTKMQERYHLSVFTCVIGFILQYAVMTVKFVNFGTSETLVCLVVFILMIYTVVKAIETTVEQDKK